MARRAQILTATVPRVLNNASVVKRSTRLQYGTRTGMEIRMVLQLLDCFDHPGFHNEDRACLLSHEFASLAATEKLKAARLMRLLTELPELS
jgi:hypothetical protein